MSEKTCIRCGGPLQLGCDGICMICLRRQGDEYARTGDIRVLFGRGTIAWETTVGITEKIMQA